MNTDDLDQQVWAAAFGTAFAQLAVAQREVAEQEPDGRWLLEVGSVPGAMAYGMSESQARENAYRLAAEVIADRAVESVRQVRSGPR